MGPSDNLPGEHHYIPQFWTKRWIGKDGFAERYTNPFAEKIVSCRKPTSAIGWRRALYDIPSYGGKISNFEIKFFRKVDQRASDIFNKIESNGSLSLSETETTDFSLFIVSLLHRSPAAIALLEGTTRSTVESILSELRLKYQFVRSANDPATFDEYRATYNEDKKIAHLSNVLNNMLLSENLVNFISNLHWFKLDLSSSRFPLLLSDDPLIRTNGIATPQGHLAMPISPSLALVGVYRREYFDQIASQSPNNLARLINTQTVESAREFVVARDKKQDSFIRNRFGKDVRPTLIELSDLREKSESKRAKVLLPPSSQFLGRIRIS